MRSLSKAVLNTDLNSINRLVEQVESDFPKGINKSYINGVISAYMRCSQNDRAQDFFKHSINKGFIPSITTIEVLVDGFLKHGDVNKAKEVMKSMEAFKLWPTIKLMNHWISYYLYSGQIDKSKALFVGLKDQGLEPSFTTFLHFINYFIHASDYSSADKIYQQMLEKDLVPDTYFYNSVLKQLLRKQSFARVDKILMEMEQRQIPPDEATFNIMIEGFSQANMLDKAQELLGKMSEMNIKPSIVTFNVLLSSQAYSLTVKQTHDLLQEMNAQGLQFNAYTYLALFRGLIAKQKFDEAVSMVLKMDKNNVQLPAEAFSAMIQLCCEHNLDGAITVLRNLAVKQNLTVNMPTYTTLLKYYLRHRKTQQVDGLLLEMQRTKNLEIGLHAYVTMLNYHVEHLDFDRIKSTLKAIQDRKIEFNDAVYNVVMKAFYVHCKVKDGGMVYRNDYVPEDPIFRVKQDVIGGISVDKIRRLFEATFGIPFRPSIHVFNEIMGHFFFSGRYAEVLECFDEVVNCKLRPNLLTMTVMIKARLYLEQPDEAIRLVRSMPEWGLKPTLVQCALIHHSLCRALQTTEAESFVQEITTKFRMHVNFVFYASLIYAYTRAGEYFYAVQTFQKLSKAGFTPDTETCNYVLKSFFELNRTDDALSLFDWMRAEGVVGIIILTRSSSRISGKLCPLTRSMRFCWTRNDRATKLSAFPSTS